MVILLRIYEAETNYRAALAVNRQLSNSLDGMIDASTSLDDIKSKLEGIQSIVQGAIDGSIADLDQAQEDINTFVNDIQAIVSTTELNDQEVFGGNFETSSLKNINVTTLDINFRNQEAGFIAPPPVAPPLPSSGGLVLNNTFSGPTGQGAVDQLELISDAAFTPITEGGTARQLGVGINANYVVSASEDVGNNTLQIHDRSGNLVVDITAAQLGINDVAAIAINDNNQIVAAGSDGVVLIEGFSTGSPGTITRLQDTTSTNYDPNPPGGHGHANNVQISNNYIAVGNTGFGSSQELVVWDLNDTGADLATAEYDFSYTNNPALGAGGIDLAINGDTLLVGGIYASGNGFAQAYDLSAGTAATRFEITDDNAGTIFGQYVELTSDGSQAIVAGGTETRIFDVATGNLTGTIDHGQALSHLGLNQRSVVDYEVDGDKLYISGGSSGSAANSRILTYDLNSYTLENSISPGVIFTPLDSHNGSLVTRTNQISNDHNLEVFDLTTIGTTANEDEFGDKVFMTDRYLAVGTPGYDSSPTLDDNIGAISIYDRLSGNLVTTIEGYEVDRPIAIAGDTLAVGRDYGIEMFDLSNGGASLGTMADTYREVTSIAISDNFIAWSNDVYGEFSFTENDGSFDGSDGTTIFGSGNYGINMSIDGNNLVVADTSSGTSVVDVIDLSTSTTIASISGLNLESTTQVDISGNAVAISNVDSANVQVYDIGGGLGNESLIQTITAPPGSAVFGDSIDLDNGRIAVGDERFNGNAGAAYLFDVNSGTLMDTIIGSGDGDGFNFLGSDVSLVGDSLAVGSRRGIDGFTGEQAGNVALYNYSGSGATENPYVADPLSVIDDTNRLRD